MTILPLPTNDTILVRAMETEDLDQVLEIENLSFSLPWPASAYLYELNQNPLSLLWVAETRLNSERSKIVGMMVVWLVLDEAHIATLAVHPEHRRQGIAKRLLTTGLVESIHRGMLSATLEVRASNLVAQHLYDEFRFKIVGYRPRYYRDNSEDALIMTVNNLDGDYLSWVENEHRICQRGEEQCILKTS